ncbi:phage protein [Brevibacillus ginsengisoli]|uniref:phage protein n=1 Tax=Brevibacillus ginsengisoli TaxID=363854 RepID=UPI003CE7A069
MGDIRSIAIYEANYQGVDVNIVLATLEAETNFTNKTGDSGKALGPGQVWPRWHTDAFQYASNRYRVEWPSTLQEQTNLVLSNDGLATAAAVYVIGRTWKGASYNFRKFSEYYVGPKIPDWDYQRRLKIYQKYAGGGVVTTGTGIPSFAPGGADAGGSGTQAQSINGVSFPSTNYGIVANSQKYGNILYGRKYRILVANKQGTALDVSQLRCTFEIRKIYVGQPNFSTVTIFNLNPTTENKLINEGDTVIVEAGYEGEQYGMIFRGDVVNAIRGKDDGVTYKLSFYALPCDRALNLGGFVNTSLAKGLTQRDVVNNLASRAVVPAKLGSISAGLSTAKLTRGKVIFGKAEDYYHQVAKTNNATFYTNDGQVNISQFTDPPPTILDLSPESGLIGTPMQSDYHITFKCLLNPKINIGSWVHIQNSQIQAQAFTPGQPAYPLDSAGLYRIIEVRHQGDTHGDQWYTECVALTQAGGVIPGIMASPSTYPK